MNNFTTNNNTLRKALKYGAPAALGLAVLALPDLAMADAAAALDDAITSGQALVGKVAPGLITIAALMTGVVLVVSLIRR